MTDPAHPVEPVAAAELNLNDYVWIKLRDNGRAILRARDARWSQLYATSYGYLPIAEQQEAEHDGWSCWQLWSLIEIFGPALGLGCDPPFETAIRLSMPLSASQESSHA